MLDRGSGMNRSTRRSYLSAMGIQTWVPRIPLPGAKQQEDLSPKEAVEEGLAEPTVSASSSVFLDSLSPTEPKAKPEKKSPEPVFGQLNKSEAPRFSLLSLLYPGQCMVISDLALTEDPVLSSAQRRLVSAILSSLGVVEKEPVQPVYFNWPLAQNQQVDQSKEAALGAMQAFMQSQTGGGTLRFVLIMGEIAGRYILPHESELSEHRGKLWSILDYPALITGSIDHMLMEPQRKREVWRDLQPLYRIVNNGC